MQFWFFFFIHFNFPGQQLYAAKRYIHVTKEGEKDSMLVLEEAVIPAANTVGIVTLEFDGNNCADGSEANNAPILLSVRT